MESDQMESSMATGSTESIDSGVSLKSDQSKAGMILFEDSPPLSRSVFSSFEEDVVSDDEDLVESSDDLRAVRNTLSEPAKSVFHIPLRQQSPFMMATGSLESINSGVSFKSDRSKDEPNDFKESLPAGRTLLPQRRSRLCQMMKIRSSLQTIRRR